MGASKIKTHKIKHYFYLLYFGHGTMWLSKMSKWSSNKVGQDQNEVIPINVNLSYDSVKTSIIIPDKAIRNTRLSANKYFFLFYHNIAKNDFYHFKNTLVVENELWSIVAHNGSCTYFVKGVGRLWFTILNMSSIFKTNYCYPKKSMCNA